MFHSRSSTLLAVYTVYRRDALRVTKSLGTRTSALPSFDESFPRIFPIARRRYDDELRDLQFFAARFRDDAADVRCNASTPRGALNQVPLLTIGRPAGVYLHRPCERSQAAPVTVNFCCFYHLIDKSRAVYTTRDLKHTKGRRARVA